MSTEPVPSDNITNAAKHKCCFHETEATFLQRGDSAKKQVMCCVCAETSREHLIEPDQTNWMENHGPFKPDGDFNGGEIKGV